jgi:tetratricopeptide (TPR) repeat protein
MTDPKDPSTGNRHKVIHWKPTQSNELNPPHSRGNKKTIIVASASILFLIVLSSWGLLSWRKSVNQSVQSAQSTLSSLESPQDGSNPRDSFANRSKADFARETAAQSLQQLRSLPNKHPSMLTRLILIEQDFLSAERLLSSSNYASALPRFERINEEIKRFTATMEDQRIATEAYDTFLSKVDELEKGKDLAPNAYERVFTTASIGRQFLDEGSFEAARRELDQTNKELASVEDAIKKHVKNNLLQGRQSLTKGDQKTATEAFRTVLIFDPENEDATRGLARAETIIKTHAFLSQAKAAEKDKQLEKALELFENAKDSDPLSAKAQQGVTRLSRKIKDNSYSAAIDTANKAEDDEDWAAAILAYEDALAVYPNKDEIKDALKLAKQKDHDTSVERALDLAYDYESDRQWGNARDTYLSVLQLEAEHEEAHSGLMRSGKMIRVLLNYDALRKMAADQASRAEFQAAIRTFNEAMAIKPDYVPFTPEDTALKNTLSEQSQPVTVTIKSDKKTWVTVSNSRLIGKISSETIRIYPGNYNIEGRRRGYEDVRLLLQVRKDHTPKEVIIICTQRTSK